MSFVLFLWQKLTQRLKKLKEIGSRLKCDHLSVVFPRKSTSVAQAGSETSFKITKMLLLKSTKIYVLYLLQTLSSSDAFLILNFGLDISDGRRAFRLNCDRPAALMYSIFQGVFNNFLINYLAEIKVILLIELILTT